MEMPNTTVIKHVMLLNRVAAFDFEQEPDDAEQTLSAGFTSWDTKKPTPTSSDLSQWGSFKRGTRPPNSSKLVNDAMRICNS